MIATAARAAALALPLIGLLAWARVGSADGESWDLVTAPGGVTVSTHASWSDCSREIQALGRTLERLMRGERTAELGPSSLICVPRGDRAAVREASARWVLWRSAPELGKTGRTSAIHSRHETRAECDAALQRRFFDLRADGYTPGISGDRAPGGRILLGGVGYEIVSYRCLPAAFDAPGTTK